jgi:peptidoglycan/LPS O-acetylase OafA/YrhL
VVLVFQEHGATAGVWLRFLTFTENYSTLTAGKFVSPIWSLGVEVLFYLLLPLIAVGVAWLAQRSPRRALAVLGALGIAAIAFRYATVIRPDEQNLWQYSLPSTFWFFVPGMALAVLAVEWERERPAWAGGALGSSSLWFAAAVALWIVVALKPDADALIGVASFLLIGPFALGLRPGRFSAAPTWRPLAALGVASYSLYLWHVPLLRAIENVNNGELPFGTLFAVAVPLAIVIALLSYAVIESPFLGMRRRWAETSPAPAEPETSE